MILFAGQIFRKREETEREHVQSINLCSSDAIVFAVAPENCKCISGASEYCSQQLNSTMKEVYAV